MYTVSELYDLTHPLAGAYLAGFRYPWEALDGIAALICRLGQSLGEDYTEAAPQVWIHRRAQVEPTAKVTGPCIIGADTQVRHGAFIRGAALIGDGYVVGNSVEVKNAILFDGVQVPHYNYVGDSILGYKSHMGAGSVTSNVKSDKSPVVIRGGEEVPTGRKKVGAMIGDLAEIGCNAVLNPGTVIGRKAVVYPLCCVRGTVPEGHILKNSGQTVKKEA